MFFYNQRTVFYRCGFVFDRLQIPRFRLAPHTRAAVPGLVGE
jgi:hypothetical protein